MRKIDELKNILEEMDVELHHADISGINDVISKSKSRIDNVISEPHPDDDQEILSQLKEVSGHLGDALSVLSSIQGKTKNGE